jgi:hypothetical protein
MDNLVRRPSVRLRPRRQAFGRHGVVGFSEIVGLRADVAK